MASLQHEYGNTNVHPQKLLLKMFDPKGFYCPGFQSIILKNQILLIELTNFSLTTPILDRVPVVVHFSEKRENYGF